MMLVAVDEFKEYKALNAFISSLSFVWVIQVPESVKPFAHNPSLSQLEFSLLLENWELKN